MLLAGVNSQVQEFTPCEPIITELAETIKQAAASDAAACSDHRI